MQWIEDLKAAIGAHFDPSGDPNIIGYLRGSGSQTVWRQMASSGSGQMLILGNCPPTRDEWSAAGVEQRSNDVVVNVGMLSGFIIL